MQRFYLTYILTFSPAFELTFYFALFLTSNLAFYMKYILTLHPTYIMTFCLASFVIDIRELELPTRFGPVRAQTKLVLAMGLETVTWQVWRKHTRRNG